MHTGNTKFTLSFEYDEIIRNHTLMFSRSSVANASKLLIYLKILILCTTCIVMDLPDLIFTQCITRIERVLWWTCCCVYSREWHTTVDNTVLKRDYLKYSNTLLCLIACFITLLKYAYQMKKIKSQDIVTSPMYFIITTIRFRYSASVAIKAFFFSYSYCHRHWGSRFAAIHHYYSYD